MLYLDHASTTPLRPAAAAAMEPFLHGLYGNPSGSHALARQAKNAIEEARERAAQLLGVKPLEVVFTGGGTESDNLAIKGAALSGGSRRGVVTVATEHEAVLESIRFLDRIGCPSTVIGVDWRGLVDPAAVAAAVDSDTAVVSVMTVNNETGVIQPLAQVAAAVRAVRPDLLIHTDAIQAFCTEGLPLEHLDLLSLAAHKFGGPKGVGLLYVKEGVNLEAVIHGGGQEMGRRSGTHNVAGIVGLVAAMDDASADREGFRRRVMEMRRRFEAKLSDRAERTVDESLCVPQISHLQLPVLNETLLVRLDRLGLAASAGSACQSGAATVSHVLTAMGLSVEHARRCLRFSFGWSSGPEDGDRAAELVLAALENQR